MDFFSTIDFIICLIVGAVVGVLAGQFMKGRGFGLIGNIVVGLVGGRSTCWISWISATCSIQLLPAW